MRTLRFLLLGLLAGMAGGYLFGLWYCLRMHAASPGLAFPLADSVYETVAAFTGAVIGLLAGGVGAIVGPSPLVEQPAGFRTSDTVQ